MAKSKGKRAGNKDDMNKVNRTAMIIGGATAAGILLVLILSLTIW